MKSLNKFIEVSYLICNPFCSALILVSVNLFLSLSLED